MLILFFATEQQEIDNVKEYVGEIRAFGDEFSHALYNEHFKVLDWDSSNYNTSYFINNTRKLTIKQRDLFQRMDKAFSLLENLMYCAPEKVIRQHDSRFEQFVDLEHYRVNRDDGTCRQSAESVATVQEAFNSVFPIFDNETEYKYKFGEMYYGNQSNYISYPILDENIDFNQIKNSFQIYNEMLIIPLDLDADLAKESVELSKNVLTFESENSSQQTDEHFDTHECQKICYLVKQYLKNTEHEQRGIFLVFYDHQYYYEFRSVFNYGNLETLIEEIERLDYENRLNPYAENLEVVLQELIGEYLSEQAKIYDQSDAKGNFGIPLYVNLVTPAKTIIKDTKKYEQVIEQLRASIVNKNIYLRELQQESSASSSFYLNWNGTQTELYSSYNELLQTLENETGIIEKQYSLDYALTQMQIGGVDHFLIAHKKQNNILVFRIVMQNLLDVPSNSQILSSSYLVNLLDFHKINDHEQVDAFNDLLLSLDDKQRNFLRSKSRGCVSSDEYFACISVINEMPHLGLMLIARRELILFSPVWEQMGQITEFADYEVSDFCFHEYRYSNDKCSIVVYINERVFNEPDEFEVKDYVISPFRFETLVSEMLNQNKLTFEEFMSEPLIRESLEKYSEFSLVINNYLTILAVKDELINFYDSFIDLLKLSCPVVNDDEILVCYISGFDAISCTGKGTLILEGFEEIFNEFYVANTIIIYTFEHKCRELLVNTSYIDCYVLVTKNEESEKIMAYNFIILPSELYRECFLKSIYSKEIEITYPFGFFNDKTLIYTDMNGLSEQEFYSLSYKASIATCDYLETEQTTQINFRFSEEIYAIAEGGEIFIEDLYIYRVSAAILVFMQLGEQPIEYTYKCQEKAFNILFDQNETKFNLLSKISGSLMSQEQIESIGANSSICLTLITLLTAGLCAYILII